MNPTLVQQLELGEFAKALPRATALEMPSAPRCAKASSEPASDPLAHAKRRSHGSPAAVESLLTFAQAARGLGISLRQFRRLVDAGKIAFVKVSERSPRVRQGDLNRFLEAAIVKYSEVQS